MLTTGKKKIYLSGKLDCKNAGIYVAYCRYYEAKDKVSAYVGRTSTSFSKRWTTYRADFKKQVRACDTAKYDNEKDSSALRRHIERYHSAHLLRPFALDYKVVSS